MFFRWPGDSFVRLLRTALPRSALTGLRFADWRREQPVGDTVNGLSFTCGDSAIIRWRGPSPTAMRRGVVASCGHNNRAFGPI
jgi:hypothetical protein